jgi:DNA-binding winged helix-turn-helix (wHTH) protein/tetratricopeptide (TPR) repeat protein
MPVYEFGPFVLDTTERLLMRGGERVPVTPKAWQILEMLVAAGGRLVRRETFYERLWPNVTVEERNLTVHMSTLRGLLEEAPSTAGLIETITGVGYRLLAEVRVLSEGSRRTSPGRPAGLVLPVGVLPFATDGLDEAEAHLGIGFAKAVAGQLGDLPVVSSRHSAANQGGIAYVLEGAVRRDSGRLSVSTQLLDVKSGAAQWRETFAQPAANAATLQDAVARRVSRWINPKAPTDQRAALATYRPRVAEAYFLQLQGRALLNIAERKPALKALELFQQAVALDPEYAVAHAGLSSTYLLMASSSHLRAMPLGQALVLARRSAQRAIALDETVGEAWATLGKIKMHYEFDWQGAEADLEHAAALSPMSVEALLAYGRFLMATGEPDASIEVVERARRVDAQRRETLELMGEVLWFAGRIEPALEALAEAIALPPPEKRPHFRRMVVFDQLGRHDQAMADRRAWLFICGELAIVDRLQEIERSRGWKAAMAEWIVTVVESANLWPQAAQQWVAAGEAGRALDALERGLAERSTPMPFILQDPALRPLHDEPRFRRIVQALGLATR